MDASEAQEEEEQKRIIKKWKRGDSAASSWKIKAAKQRGELSLSSQLKSQHGASRLWKMEAEGL